MRLDMVSGAIASIAVAAALNAAPAAAQPAGGSGPVTVQTSANPGPLFNRLNAVTEFSPTDRWAVGERGGRLLGLPLIEHSTGGAWTGQRGSDIPDGDLFGVAAVSATDAWAVGGSNALPATQPIIEHYNGHRWQFWPSPAPSGAELRSVAVVSKTDVWAVGLTSEGVLIEHWNGRGWHRVAAPGGQYSGLYSVTAVAADDVWAAGQTGADSGLIEHWNGRSWAVAPSPFQHGTYLRGVCAAGADDVWAVGEQYVPHRFYATLTQHWNGHSWRTVPSPNLGSRENKLTSVGCGPNGPWAAGWATQIVDHLGFSVPLLLHRAGGSWQIVPIADRFSANASLAGISVGAGGITAVGTQGRISGRTLVLHTTP